MSDGDFVKQVQRALNEHGYALTVDGIAGPKTERAVLMFQKKHGLYTDGLIGPLTQKLLFADAEHFEDVKDKLKFVKISCDKVGKGANVTYLREDVKEDFKSVRKALHAVGAKLTSSGGRRLLSASVGKNRSQTSLHYLGVAHDLFVWSGMVDPKTDPYVVIKHPEKEKRFIVYARAIKGEMKTLKGYTYDHEEIEVTDRFINLTELFTTFSFRPIRARKSFFSRKNKMGAEWWHFQHECVLVPGDRFGDQLLKSYRLDRLMTYSLWNHRHVEWKKNWF